MISADITNNQDVLQPFTCLTRVTGEDNSAVFLSWLAGTLSPGQPLSPAQSWVPSEAGIFSIEVFVWESVRNPGALSAPPSMQVVVVADADAADTAANDQIWPGKPVRGRACFGADPLRGKQIPACVCGGLHLSCDNLVQPAFVLRALYLHCNPSPNAKRLTVLVFRIGASGCDYRVAGDAQ